MIPFGLLGGFCDHLEIRITGLSLSLIHIYCATCDAPLYRGKTAAIIGFSPKEEAEADFMAEMADKVYYIPMYEADVNVADSVEVLREKPVSVEGSLKVQELVTDRNRYDVDGVFFLRESVSPAQLVPGLKIEDNHIAVDRQMRTNLAGCFACGDAVGAPSVSYTHLN